MGGKTYPPNARTLDDALMGDGYVYRGFIAAVPRKHGQFKYAFRPMMSEEITVIEESIKSLVKDGKRAEAEKLVAKTISEKVTWCDATEAGTLTVDEARRLHQAVFNRCYLQLIGAEPMDESDEDGKTSSQQLGADLKN